MEAQTETTSLQQCRISARQLICQLKHFYEAFSKDTIALLDTLYTQDVEFRDPVHTVHGTLALKHYLRQMADKLTLYRIRYLDEQIGENSAYLSWEMDFEHPSLKGGATITVRGISHLKFTSKVYYHEDCYDLGALLYDHVPVLGNATRALKNRMARQH